MNLVLIAYASSESRGTFRQKARSLAPLNGWACAVEICHDRMLEDTNSLDGAHIRSEARVCGPWSEFTLFAKVQIRECYTLKIMFALTVSSVRMLLHILAALPLDSISSQH